MLDQMELVHFLELLQHELVHPGPATGEAHSQIHPVPFLDAIRGEIGLFGDTHELFRRAFVVARSHGLVPDLPVPLLHLFLAVTLDEMLEDRLDKVSPFIVVGGWPAVTVIAGGSALAGQGGRSCFDRHIGDEIVLPDEQVEQCIELVPAVDRSARFRVIAVVGSQRIGREFTHTNHLHADFLEQRKCCLLVFSAETDDVRDIQSRPNAVVDRLTGGQRVNAKRCCLGVEGRPLSICGDSLQSHLVEPCRATGTVEDADPDLYLLHRSMELDRRLIKCPLGRTFLELKVGVYQTLTLFVQPSNLHSGYTPPAFAFCDPSCPQPATQDEFFPVVRERLAHQGAGARKANTTFAGDRVNQIRLDHRIRRPGL